VEFKGLLTDAGIMDCDFLWVGLRGTLAILAIFMPITSLGFLQNKN